MTRRQFAGRDRQTESAACRSWQMAKLDELLTIDGVVAVGEFSADGTLIAYRSKTHMPPEMLAKSAQFCATVSMMFSTLAGALEQTTSMSWTPQKGWAYSGGDLTVAVGGRIGVFIKTEKADFNQLFQALIG
jgi:roadblock/LC7 domain-containing protein